MPRASGLSGPTTVRSGFLSRANANRFGKSSAPIFTHSTRDSFFPSRSSATPALPGAHHRCLHRFLNPALPVLLALVALATRAAVEPLGPSSRRTGLVISEIMYHPLPRADGKNLEFIEVYNSEATPADISGFRLSGAVDFTFPANTILAPLSFLVVAPVPADVQGVYSLSGVLGSFGNPTNSLPNDTGTIRLRNKAGAVLLEVTYSDEPPWPPAADGAGHSLVLARPSL